MIPNIIYHFFLPHWSQWSAVAYLILLGSGSPSYIVLSDPLHITILLKCFQHNHHEIQTRVTSSRLFWHHQGLTCPSVTPLLRQWPSPCFLSLSNSFLPQGLTPGCHLSGSHFPLVIRSPTLLTVESFQPSILLEAFPEIPSESAHRETHLSHSLFSFLHRNGHFLRCYLSAEGLVICVSPVKGKLHESWHFCYSSLFLQRLARVKHSVDIC